MIFQRILEARAKVTPAEKRAFARQIDRLVRQTGKLEAQKVDDVLALLKKAQGDLSSRILRLPKGRAFSRSAARQLKGDAERLMFDFADKASRELGYSQKQFADLGLDFTRRASSLQGRTIPRLSISPDLVENAATRSADLVRSISMRHLGELNDLLNVGVITGRHPLEVAQDMSQRFDKSLGQMETVARTEMLGIHSQVQYAQLLDMEETTPGLKKLWVAIVGDGRTRETHLEVNGTSLPVRDPFQVGDSELQYPRDPNGEAKEVINCRCTLLPDFSDAEDPLQVGPIDIPVSGLAAEVRNSLERDAARRA